MTNGNGTPPEAAPPQLNVLAQYTKDLSFENPNAPARWRRRPQPPQINIQINVGANKVARKRIRGDDLDRGQGGKRRQDDVQLRAGLCRRVPHPQHAAGEPAADAPDRMPAAAIPVCAGDHRHRRARWRLPAADARPGRFRRPVPAEHGAAGRSRQAARPTATSRAGPRETPDLPPDIRSRSACRPGWR